jgi:hypothetical protein
MEHRGLAVTLALAAAAVAFAVSVATPSPSVAKTLGGAAITALVIWSAASRRYHLTLAALLLWLGLLDGFVRLKTGDEDLTLIRDALLYAIVIGWLVRTSVQAEPLRLPPLAGWSIAFVAVVLVQLFNPANESIEHSLAALRPHIGWVPLFFLGYLVMRTRRRLRTFLILLLAITAVNGIVAVYQSGLTPEEFAAWGPGYDERIHGTGDVSGRVGFGGKDQEQFVRPFALGSDYGFGGAVGALAAPAGLALLALGRRRRVSPLTVVLAAGVVVAVATSQSRTAVVTAVAAVAAFLVLTVVWGRLWRPLLGLITVAVLAITIGPLAASIGGFNRYESIAPGRALATFVSDRGDSLGKLPGYVTDFPLGAGLGSVGPAAREIPRSERKSLNAETEFNFLVIELGIGGLLVLLAFNIRLLALAVARLRRVVDADLRLLLAAVAAPLFAIFVTWVSGITTATSPNAPYLWFAGGTLAYWLGGRDRSANDEALADRATPARSYEPAATR